MIEEKSSQKLPLAVESFERLRETNQYYVDKTLLIRDVIKQEGDPLLFTRPRRFGKTLNMSMLKAFFERSDEDTSTWFAGTAIEGAESNVLDHQGQYPVIFLSFKDTDGNSAQSIVNRIYYKIKSEYERQRDHIMKIGSMNPNHYESMQRFISANPDEDRAVGSLNALTYYLHAFYGVKPVILIDEYDAPISRAWAIRYREHDCYERIVGLMRDLLSATIKSNFDISYACLTGIEHVAKATGESGLNNLRTFGVLDNEFSQYFGFTHNEVKTLLETYGAIDHYEEVCEWYQGYHFGDTEMFNPVSVLNYLHEGCTPKPYWPLTSHNATIGDVLEYATPAVLSDLSKLAIGESVRTEVYSTLVYPDLPGGTQAVFTLLLGAGYLTPATQLPQSRSEYGSVLDLVIPNNELRIMYDKEIYGKAARSSCGNPMEEYAQLKQSILSGNASDFQKAMRQLLLKLLGPNDVGGGKKEDAYHMLLVGLLGPLMGSYVLTSNANAGEGRCDISLRPIRPGDPGVIIEVKAGSDETESMLTKLANEALKQIDMKRYTTQAGWESVGRIFKFGAAFSKKLVRVVWEED